jgi:hypothetical protein
VPAVEIVEEKVPEAIVEILSVERPAVEVAV